jgi:hypothetical protein
VTTVTLGVGLSDSQGQGVDVASIRDLAELLEAEADGIEAWWSPHAFDGDRRKADNWLSAIAAVLDVDTRSGRPPECDDDHARLMGALLSGGIESSAFHATPKGARVVLLYRAPMTDRALAKRAEQGAAARVSRQLDASGLGEVFEVDEQTVGDLARLFFTARAHAKGVQRDGDVFSHEARFDPADLAKDAPLALPEAELSVGEAAPYRGENHADALRVLNEQCAKVLASKGTRARHNTRNTAGYVVGRYVGSGHLDRAVAEQLLVAAARAASETPDKAEREVRLAIAAGVAKPSDLGLADAFANFRRGRDAAGGEDDELDRARLDVANQLGTKRATSLEIKFAPATDLFNKQFQPTAWQVEKLLVERSVFAISAEPKASKTWAALEIAFGIASGTPVFGHFRVARPQQVVLFLAEDSERSVRNRLRALAASRRLTQERAAEVMARIHFVCLRTIDLHDDEHLARLVVGCRCVADLGVVLLDPLRDLHHGDENDSTAMSDVMGRLRALRSILGCSVMFCHHASKQSSATSGRRPGQQMRGSSAIHGAIDGAIHLQDLETDGSSYWKTTVHVEVKGASGAGTFALKLDVDDDQFGEARRVTWTHERETASSATEKVMQRILAALSDGNALSYTNVTSVVGGKKALIKPALAELVKRRLVHYQPVGNRSVYTVTEEGRAHLEKEAPKPSEPPKLERPNWPGGGQ